MQCRVVSQASRHENGVNAKLRLRHPGQKRSGSVFAPFYELEQQTSLRGPPKGNTPTNVP
jgi:hypothetical protein